MLKTIKPVKTNNPNFRIKSKTFFIMYKTKDNLDLQTVKSYLFSAFSVLSENELNFFIININTQEINTIIVLLKFSKTQEVRNSENQNKLSLNINNKIIEGIYFPIKGSSLAMLYLLQLNAISNNKNYTTNFDDNSIAGMSQHLISFNLKNKTELNIISNEVNSNNINVSETNNSLN